MGSSNSGKSSVCNKVDVEIFSTKTLRPFSAVVMKIVGVIFVNKSLSNFPVSLTLKSSLGSIGLFYQ